VVEEAEQDRLHGGEGDNDDILHEQDGAAADDDSHVAVVRHSCWGVASCDEDDDDDHVAVGKVDMGTKN
jgi:hypothetical protein